MAERHRSTLKQKNKPFKPQGKNHPRQKSKGRAAPSAYAPIDWTTLNKNDRLNFSIQKRKNVREELKRKRRGLAETKGLEVDMEGENYAPKVIALLAMNNDCETESLSQSLLEMCENHKGYTVTPSWAAKNVPLKFLNVQRNMLKVLDACKVADVLLLVFSCKNADLSRAKLDPFSCSAYDGLAYEFLTAIRTQGMPKVVGVLQGLSDHTPNKQKDMKKLYNRYFESEFPDQIKIIETEKLQNVMRALSQAAVASEEMKWREIRSYMLAESISHDENYQLQISGFLKGSGHLNPNQLVHITGYGDYQIHSIQTKDNLYFADNPESLNAENEPSPFCAEQTWPTEDELAEAMSRLEIVKTDHNGVDFPVDDEEEENSIWLDESTTNFEFEGRKPEEREFDDEVDTPVDKLAKERFAKYRGLKSFRTSAWDPYENLPREYARLFEFTDTNKKVKSLSIQAVKDSSITQQGSFIQITLRNFPISKYHENPQPYLILSSVLPHERKLSVLNFKLQLVPGCTSNLISKESVFFHCGFRRFTCNPIYSEDSLNADKNKYLKSVKDENPVVASIYAPAMFKPANLLVFKETMEGHELVAKGNLVSFDPKRLVIKRVLLTGYPIKVIFI